MPSSHRGERALAWVGRAQVQPVLRGTIVERQQLVTNVLQAFTGLGVLRFVRGQEFVEGTLRVLARVGHPDRVHLFFRLRLQVLRQFIEHVGGFVDPAALLARRGKHLLHRPPEVHGAVADGYVRIDRESTRLDVQEQFLPVLFAFAKAVLNRSAIFCLLSRPP